MPENNTWTVDAMESGDIAKIRDRVLADADYLNERDDCGNTPLLNAIGFADLSLVRFLLEHQADPNAEVDDGYTCLLSAVESDSPNSLAILDALLEAGADVGGTGTNGWTPLHMAAARGHGDKTKRLIDAGSDINRRTEVDGGETPLMEAAYAGHPETVQLLLKAGADASLRETTSDRTALEIAQYVAQGPDPEVAEILKEESINVEFQDLIDDMGLDPEAVEVIKQSMQDYDMVESYIASSRALVEEGNHAEVIRLLSEKAD